jgi:PleD family two-component response regulator
VLSSKASLLIEKIFFTAPSFVAIRGAKHTPHVGVIVMADKEDLELEDEVSTDDADDSVEAVVEVAKTNLTKRRIIDNYLEERRLQRQLSDYDFDL